MEESPFHNDFNLQAQGEGWKMVMSTYIISVFCGFGNKIQKMPQTCPQ